MHFRLSLYIYENARLHTFTCILVTILICASASRYILVYQNDACVILYYWCNIKSVQRAKQTSYVKPWNTYLGVLNIDRYIFFLYFSFLSLYVRHFVNLHSCFFFHSFQWIYVGSWRLHLSPSILFPIFPTYFPDFLWYQIQNYKKKIIIYNKNSESYHKI